MVEDYGDSCPVKVSERHDRPEIWKFVFGYIMERADRVGGKSGNTVALVQNMESGKKS